MRVEKFETFLLETTSQGSWSVSNPEWVVNGLGRRFKQETVKTSVR